MIRKKSEKRLVALHAKLIGFQVLKYHEGEKSRRHAWLWIVSYDPSIAYFPDNQISIFIHLSGFLLNEGLFEFGALASFALQGFGEFSHRDF